MKFILHEIKLWFKNKTFEAKSYRFLPNKINVITGDSSTGKSSFLNIIDYCLLSDQVKIPSTITNAVEWFGIKFSINNENVFIVRKSANNGAPSIDLFLSRTSFPDIPSKNSGRNEIMDLLDKSFNIDLELKNRFNISFRDFLLFNSLTENIIASPELYFDTPYFEGEYPKGNYIDKLKQVFNLITGITTFDKIIAKSKLDEVEKNIKNIEKNKIKNKNNDDKYKKNLKILLEECVQNNLLDECIIDESTDKIVENIEKILPATNSIENSNNLHKIDELKNKRNNLKSELSLYRKYQKECANYRNNLNKTADSLQPIEFLNKNLKDQILYPFETIDFLQILEESLKKIKNDHYGDYIFPEKLEKEIVSINKEINLIDEEIERIKRSTNMSIFENRDNCFLLGKINEKLENIKLKHKVIEINEEELEQKKKIYDELLEILNSNEESVENEIINQLNTSIKFFYNSYNTIPNYSNYEPKFEEKEITLNLYPLGDMFPINNLGSKSNFMFMHLYFYLGLHYSLLNVATSYVPQFLFIDQPSIPYYEGNDDNLKLSDAFNLLNKFIDIVINEKNKDFQIFMVEHAPKENWESTLIHFHTVDEFLNGVALIPQQLIKND